jgi:hypothetical protein
MLIKPYLFIVLVKKDPFLNILRVRHILHKRCFFLKNQNKICAAASNRDKYSTDIILNELDMGYFV